MNSKYILLEIGPDSKLRDKKIVCDEIQSSLDDLKVAIFYPTHDQKCYLGLKTGCMNDLYVQVKDKLLKGKTARGLSVKLVEPKKDQDKLVILATLFKA